MAVGTGTFADKVVIVTGATSGLGEAAAVTFAREGASVVVTGRREEKGQEVVRRLEELGAEAMFIKVDVSQRADVEAMVETTLARFGKLDCAVNNAGILGPVLVPVAEVEEEDWDEVMNVNLKGVWLCMKYQIPAMLTAGSGAIVNVSSVRGFKPSDTGHAPYSASKHGVIGLSKTAAIDYGQQGIRVNVVAPGYARSEMVDTTIESAPDMAKAMIAKYSAMNRIGEASEVAEATVWLCSDAASYVNGAVLVVNGGDTTRLY